MHELVCQEWLNYRINQDLRSAEHNLCWNCGVQLDQVIFREQEDGWQARLKGERHGRPVVFFFVLASLSDAMELVAEFTSKGCIDWLEDKWPSKHLQASGRLKKSF